MKRALGYCINENCDEVYRGTFLLGHESVKFHCNSCRGLGFIVSEYGEPDGEGEYFSEVRVEFNYDPIAKEYKGVAIVRDTGLPGGKTYIMHSPLIRTDKRATKVAEELLATLAYTLPDDKEILQTGETVLNLSDPMDEFMDRLESLSERWAGSTLSTSVLSKDTK
jgi:hypothetical protein